MMNMRNSRPLQMIATGWLVAAMLAGDIGAEDWPTYKKDPARTGVTAYVASDDGQLYCLNAKTGKLVWGYLSVTDDLLLGSHNVPITAGQPAESHLLWRSESNALFALDKKDGSLRWVYRPSRGRIVANIEIAFGDGRLFLINGTSKADLARARRRHQEIQVELTLIALDLADGSELWRQDDVPVLGDRSALSRLKTNVTHLFMGQPSWGHLVYADGVVLYGANAAYDAATGKKLWEKTTRPGKLPVVYGDSVITSQNAYELHSGEQCMAEDLLTGQSVPWRYSRAYGCGPIAGCQHLLFFRPGLRRSV